uniref:Uncharacterized protein n=1 Tax=Ditylenchus dipsaci TaxID=166011 RepID=A0A915EUX0_9BILA
MLRIYSMRCGDTVAIHQAVTAETRRRTVVGSESMIPVLKPLTPTQPYSPQGLSYSFHYRVGDSVPTLIHNKSIHVDIAYFKV